MQTLLLVTTVGLAVGYPLLWLFLEERVKNLAREETEKALADYRHVHERLLAAANADHQRRLQEFGLFTQRQHRVYARLYQLARAATDGFASMLGFVMSPDFSKYSLEDAKDFLREHHVKEVEAHEALQAYEKSLWKEAGKLMDDVLFKIKRRDADIAFNRMKNFEALHELYLSDSVRQQMAVLRTRVATISVLLRDEDEGPNRAHDKEDEMSLALLELFQAMREEMRRGTRPEALIAGGSSPPVRDLPAAT